MRGELPVVGVRLRPREIKQSWSDWISELSARRAGRRREQLELIERVGREQRRALRTGEFHPVRGAGRRWC